jgi:hypothetical protein
MPHLIKEGGKKKGKITYILPNSSLSFFLVQKFTKMSKIIITSCQGPEPLGPKWSLHSKFCGYS